MQAYSEFSANLFKTKHDVSDVEEQDIRNLHHYDVNVVFDACKGAMLIARRAFFKNETIVSALTCRIPHEVRKEVKNFDFYKYLFVNAEDFRNSGHCCDGFIAFGPMSFCNHSETPNAEVAWETINDRTVLHLRAWEQVPENTEITMRYANLSEYIGSDEWK